MSLNQNWNDLDGAQFLGSPGSFSFVSGLSPLFTFARASSGTFWNGGNLLLASSGAPRFEAAGGPLGGYGLLVEPQSTNGLSNNTMAGAVRDARDRPDKLGRAILCCVGWPDEQYSACWV